MMHTKILARIVYPSLFFVFCQHTVEAGTMMSTQNFVAFGICLSEKEAVLINPANKKVAMWDNAFQRIADRNMPWIEITNVSQSVAEITEFLLDLGDSAADFGFGEETFGAPILPSSANPEDIDINAVLEQNGSQLRVTFSNFEPGDSVRFRIDLEADDPAAHPHPDFRRVLFDGLPAVSSPDGVDDNAFVQVTYSNGAMLLERIPEFMVDPTAAQYFEGNLRLGKQMDPVEIFKFGGQIPEPSTWAMAALAIVFAAGWAKRRPGRS